MMAFAIPTRPPVKAGCNNFLGRCDTETRVVSLRAVTDLVRKDRLAYPHWCSVQIFWRSRSVDCCHPSHRMPAGKVTRSNGADAGTGWSTSQVGSRQFCQRRRVDPTGAATTASTLASLSGSTSAPESRTLACFPIEFSLSFRASLWRVNRSGSTNVKLDKSPCG